MDSDYILHASYSDKVNLIGSVSYNMLLESLKECELVYIPKTHDYCFFRYETVPGDENANNFNNKPGTLCLCHQEISKSLLKRNTNCFCVILTSDEKIPAWVDEENMSNRVIFIRQTERFYHYDSVINNLFKRNLIWENEMDRIIYNRGSINQLIEVGEQALNSFIAVTDNGYNIIACSNNIDISNLEPYYAEFVEQGCFDKQEIGYIEKYILPNAHEKDSLIISEPNYRHKCTIMHYPIYIDNMFLFYTLMVCQEGNLLSIQDLFRKFLLRLEVYCNDYWKNNVDLEARWHRVLVGIIDHTPMSEGYLETQFGLTNIPLSRQFRLLYCQFEENMPYKKRSEVVKSAKNMNSTYCYPFMYKGILLVLCYSLSDNDAPLAGIDNWAEVRNILYNPHGIACGVSQVFFDIKNLDYAFKQAASAYAYRRSFIQEYQTLFGNEPVVCYPFDYILTYYVLSKNSDPDLIQYSFENSILRRLINEDKENGTSVAKIITTFIENERNATKTSQQVFVHRNTVLYHVARFEKRFNVSLDSPFLRSRILLDYKHYLAEKI